MLIQSPAWQALQSHHDQIEQQGIRELFSADPERAAAYRLAACGLTLDYSKNLFNATTLELLFDLAEQQELTERRAAMFRGDRINFTEDRAVLHTALRSARSELMLDGSNIMLDVNAVLDKMAAFVDAVRSGEHTGYTGKPVRTVVNIGIGGSDLGPKMVTRALAHLADDDHLSVQFVSNVDSAQFQRLVGHLDPETTLFVIASKTFTTQETMLNAHTARNWFLDKTGGNGDVSRHFVAVSTALEHTRAFGIEDDNVFGFWDWVGGRYSLWSAIGLPIALYLGMPAFRELLAGAADMDRHFCEAPMASNMPVILGMLGVWYNNFCAARQYLILPYSYPLEEFPAYVQQLDMESNGKSVDVDGRPVDYATGPIAWGGLGSNAQHAFYQLVHQGTHIIPADFIVARGSGGSGHAVPLAANCIGQMQALLDGRSSAEVSAEMPEGSDLVAHRVFGGNRPSNAIVMDDLAPRTLGALIALYEHKVFVQGVVWHINSFDQWGVELGKKLAKALEPSLSGAAADSAWDSSTRALIEQMQAK